MQLIGVFRPDALRAIKLNSSGIHISQCLAVLLLKELTLDSDPADHDRHAKPPEKPDNTKHSFARDYSH